MNDERAPAAASATIEATRERAGEASVACGLCDQRVTPGEAVTLDVESAGRETLCTFCAGSLFEDPEVTSDGGVERRDRGVTAAEQSGASAASWEPSPPAARGALPGPCCGCTTSR